MTNNHSKTPPVALTIAGSDSGAGAGIQADLKTFSANAVYGTCAITAITAQNTMGVKAIEYVSPKILEAQILSIITDFSLRSVKTGMIGEPELADIIAFFATNGELPRLVIDPVMVATSGDSLSADTMVASYRTTLFPHALVITPNITEAEILSETEIRSINDMIKAAKILHGFGSKYVYLKGGHLAGEDAVDVFYDGKTIAYLRAKRIETNNVHGTGCTFSAALSAALARGATVEVAVRAAKVYTTKTISGAKTWALGRGSGPLNHFGWQ